MKKLLPLAVAATFTAATCQAALNVELHPDALGNIIVYMNGSGVTGPDSISAFTNGITFGEQWSNLTGNPFDDTLNPDNFDLIFDTPLLVQQEGATDVFFTGIQIDNDGTGSDQDDFRIYASEDMLANTAYSVDAIATVTPALSFANLTPGTYTDDADGGTTFLNGFSLVISNEVIPEPSALALTFIGLIFLSTRRHR